MIKRLVCIFDTTSDFFIISIHLRLEMKHFAYGSNMDLKDMKKCAEEDGVELINLKNGIKHKLKNYKIDFTRRSTRKRRHKMGVSDIIYNPGVGDFCWGVIFDISESDLEILDKKEGVRKYKNGKDCGAYKRLTFKNGMITYVVRKREKFFVQPHNEYVEIMIKGSKDYDLPPSWIKHLESFKE